LKVIVLDKNGNELYTAEKGLIVLADKGDAGIRSTMKCSGLQLIQFVMQLMDELYGCGKEELSEDGFLALVAQMSNIVSRNHRSKIEVQ